MTDDEKASEAAQLARSDEAASALTAAIQDVAALAHTPTVLVETMFTTLQRQMERIGDRMDEGSRWMMQTDKLVTELDRKVGVQNGGVKEALQGIRASNEWHAAHDKRLADAALIAVGKHEVIGVPRVAVEATQTFLEKVWPLIVTAIGCLVVGAVTVAAFTVSWWPW